jgi:predicted outer membrane repeat protein
MFEFLRRWRDRSSQLRKKGAAKVSKHQSRPRLELLEDRIAPAVFNVNSLADVLNPSAGIVTLRSAIEAANATPGGNTINLTVAGSYNITLPGTPGEVDNAAGEFAISAAGGNLTIQNTSGGAVTVNGDHLSRVFDINPIFTIGSAVVTNGGSGFTSAPKVTLTGGGGTGATATAAVANGHVISVTITNPGSGFTSAPIISFSGGGGKGAAATAIVASPKINVTMNGFTIENGNANGGNVPAGAGGGIRDNNNASLTLTNMVITNNSASADGGGVSMTDLVDFPWALVLNNTTVSDNHAGDQGGGVEEDGTGLVKINAGSVITGNTSTNEGAGVYLDAVPGGGVFNVTVTAGGTGFTKAPAVTFSGGGGTGAAGTAIIAGGRVVGVTITNPGTGFIAAPTITFTGGGGRNAAATANLTLGTSTLDITGTVITDNVSLDAIGGGVANSGDGVVNITSSTLANNFAATTGGGFSDENNEGTLNVANSLFLNNTAAGNGGAIFVGSPNTTITNTEIDNNSSGGNGGGLFAGGVKLTVLASTFADNDTSGNGGGIEFASSGGGLANGSTVTSSTITGNIALNRTEVTAGGGIGAAAAFTGELSLVNDTINGNFAASGGGVSAANTAGSAFVVENTIIAGNFADNLGQGTDAAGAFIDNGGNLIGISGLGSGDTGFTAVTTQSGTAATPLNPMLGPLENNGGPTVGAKGDSMTLQTEALQPGSPAIGKGVAGTAPVDERGFLRDDAASGALPDVGAFAFENATLSVSVAPSAPTAAVDGSVTFTITVANTSANALPNDNSLVTVSLPPNLTLAAIPAGATVSGNTVTFSLGDVAAGGEVMFTLMTTANATGTATVGASVTSPDADPNTVSNTGSVIVS